MKKTDSKCEHKEPLHMMQDTQYTTSVIMQQQNKLGFPPWHLNISVYLENWFGVWCKVQSHALLQLFHMTSPRVTSGDTCFKGTVCCFPGKMYFSVTDGWNIHSSGDGFRLGSVCRMEPVASWDRRRVCAVTLRGKMSSAPPGFAVSAMFTFSVMKGNHFPLR